MPYLFTPPSIQRGAFGPFGLGGGLFARMSIAQGQTLLKKDGFYTLLTDPDGSQIDDADIAYLGGHVYTVDDAEARDLIAAGYGDGLSGVPVPPTPQGGYGVGVYGTGNYGDGDPDPTANPSYGSGPYGAGPFGD